MLQKSEEKINDDLKKIAKSSIIVLIAIFLSKAFTYIYRILIARSYGPEIYGVFTLALMLSGWFIAASSLGLNSGLLRYISVLKVKNKKIEIKNIFWKSIFYCLISTIVSVILLFLMKNTISITWFKEPTLANFLPVFIFSIPLTVFFEIFLSTFVAYEMIGFYSIIHKVLTGFFRVLFISIFIFYGMTYSSISLSYIFSLIIPFILVIFATMRFFPFLFKLNLKGVFKKSKLFAELFSYSWPLLLYSFIWQIFHWTDSFMIGIFTNATQVGIYNSAIEIAFLLSIAPGLFIQLFFPLVTANYSNNNLEGVKQVSQQVGKWILFINIPIFILFLFFPNSFINLFFGNQFLAASNSLRFISAGMLLLSLSEVSNKLLSMRNKTKNILFCIIVSSLLNIILNWILIPKYGINGAAFATMISFFILGLLFMLQAYSFFSIIPIRRKIINLLFSALISSIFLFFLKKLVSSNLTSNLLVLSTFFLLYILFSFLLKSFDKYDFMILRTSILKAFSILAFNKKN